MCFPVECIGSDISHDFEFHLPGWMNMAVYLNIFPGQEAHTLLEHFVPLSYNGIISCLVCFIRFYFTLEVTDFV